MILLFVLMTCWLGWGAVLNALDPQPGLTVSAVGAPRGGSHRPWMWEGDAWSGTEPRARDSECSGFELRSSSPQLCFLGGPVTPCASVSV